MEISFLTALGIAEDVAKKVIKQHNTDVEDATKDIKTKYETLDAEVTKGRLEEYMKPYAHLNKAQKDVLLSQIDTKSENAKKDLDKKAKELGWNKPSQKLDVDADKKDGNNPLSTETSNGDKTPMTNAFGIPITAVHKI